MAANAIKEAVYALRPLHRKVEKFFQFEEEVRETITSVFEKHRSGQDVCRSPHCRQKRWESHPKTICN